MYDVWKVFTQHLRCHSFDVWCIWRQFNCCFCCSRSNDAVLALPRITQTARRWGCMQVGPNEVFIKLWNRLYCIRSQPQVIWLWFDVICLSPHSLCVCLCVVGLLMHTTACYRQVIMGIFPDLFSLVYSHLTFLSCMATNNGPSVR